MNEPSSWKGVYEDFLWALVEDAHSLVAETLRLGSQIPAAIIEPLKSRFKMILVDFAYFQKSDFYEKQIGANKELDDLFYDQNEDVLKQFEQLLNAVANFIKGFHEYCEQRASEIMSIQDIDLARELEIEALSILGQLLLLIDRTFPGKVAEYLYVAIYRNSDDRTHVEFLVDFLRVRTNNQDTLFMRVTLNDKFIRAVIAVFDTGLQNVSTNWLVRLRPRASQVFCSCLFFAPYALNDASLMRKLVDNYFREQWVVALGMGTVVNLLEEWQSYKPAVNALMQQIDLSKARGLAEDYFKRLHAIEIPQGTITADRLRTCIHVLAQYNSTLRWLILHSYDIGVTSKRGQQYVAAVQMATQFQTRALRSTLRVANFEIEFFKTYNQYLNQKEESIKKLTTTTCDMIGEIAAVFSQGFASLKVEKKTKLHDWLLLMKKTLEESDTSDPKGGEIAIHIKRRIAQVGEMLDLGGNLAMAQYLEKVSQQLDALAATYGVSQADLRRAEREACPAYAWTIVDSWTPQVEKLLVESSNSAPVRALFHKMSLAVSTLAADLHTEERKRCIGLAYSWQLEGRLRTMIQSVPRHLFVLLREKVSPLLEVNWPPQIPKEQAKAMADFESNFKLAEATSTICNMSVGISRMALTRVGTVEVRPRELLSDGIRRELTTRLPETMMIKEKENSLKATLSALTKSLHSLHTSFLYLCEHIDVAAHEMWRKEVNGALERMADDECSSIIAQAGADRRPNSSIALQPTTPLGLVVKMLLSATNPSTHRYSNSEMSWRDAKYSTETLSSNETNGIESWIPSVAIACIDRILCCLLEHTGKDILRAVKNVLGSMPSFTLDDAFFQSKPFEALQKSTSSQPNLLSDIAKAGQYILLRRLLLQSRSNGVRLRTPALWAALDAANRLALRCPDSAVDVESLVDLLRHCSFTNPMLTRFAGFKTPTHVPLILFTALLVHLPKLTNGSRPLVCPTSFFIGFRWICLQFDVKQEVLSHARLFNDSILILLSSSKVPSHFNAALPTLERIEIM